MNNDEFWIDLEAQLSEGLTGIDIDEIIANLSREIEETMTAIEAEWLDVDDDLFAGAPLPAPPPLPGGLVVNDESQWIDVE